jgi:molybdate transport system ATP-binding protein
MIELDFELRRGAFTLEAKLAVREKATGLIGPSGSGKTTLLLALAGILKPRRGVIRLTGERDFFDSSRGSDRPGEKRRVGVVFQENLLFPHLNVRDNLLFGYRRTDPALRRLRPEEVFDLLGLGDLLERGVGSLSGGEARRTAIGRALLASPCLLLLDEPLTGLDLALRDRVLACLLRLKNELSIPMLFVSHRFSDLAAVADTLALLAVEPGPEGGRLARVSPLGPPYEKLVEAGRVASLGPLETVIPGVALESPPGAGYSVVLGEGLRMYVSTAGIAPGTRCYVTLRADEVILAQGELPKLSSRNVWPGRVETVRRLDGVVVVTLDVGPRILAEVTGEAARDLDLAPGIEVRAIVKARSLRATALGRE